MPEICAGCESEQRVIAGYCAQRLEECVDVADRALTARGDDWRYAVRQLRSGLAQVRDRLYTLAQVPA